MGNDRGKPSHARRELRTAPHPSSLYSTSQNSGRPLVPGPKVISRDRSTLGRSGPPSSFSVDQQSNTKSSSRKTKLIIALGLTLPVLACIIGIVAWAMTTDIVRISPQPVRTNFRGIGSKDKSTRRDSLQPRSDHDLDLLLLTKDGEVQLTSKRTTSRSTTTGRTTSVSTPVERPGISSNSSKTTSSATATEILTKLISSSVNKNGQKGPPQFVVFAPVPDDSKTTKSSEAKKDLKINIDDETDLVAEESSRSDEFSKDFPPINSLRLEKRPLSRHHGEPGRFNEVRDSRAGPPDSREPFPRRSLDKRQHPVRNMHHPDFDSAALHRMMNNGNIQPPPPGMQFNNPNPPRALHPNMNHPVNEDFSPRRVPSRHDDRPPPSQYQKQPPQNQHQYPPPVHQNQHIQNRHQYPQQPTGDQNEDTFLRKYPHQPIHDPPYNGPNTNNDPGIPHSDNFGDPNKYDNMYSGSQNLPAGSPYSEPGGPQPSNSMYQSNGAPQYYAPPPQTFHTSTSYGSGNVQNSKSGSPMSTYENIGTSAVSQGGQTGSHHHHHHHHHHDPNDGGDTHLASASSTNDADRLGTVGIGLGTPRGITLQVGGLGGLLPIGALGIVRGLASSLLPRPQLGLNRKVFFGVEVGRGGGLAIG